MGRPTPPGSSSRYGANSAEETMSRARSSTPAPGIAQTGARRGAAAWSRRPERPVERALHTGYVDPRAPRIRNNPESARATGSPHPSGSRPTPPRFRALRIRSASGSGLRARRTPCARRPPGLGRPLGAAVLDQTGRGRALGMVAPRPSPAPTGGGVRVRLWRSDGATKQRPREIPVEPANVATRSQPRLPGRPLLPMRRVGSRSGAG